MEETQNECKIVFKFCQIFKVVLDFMLQEKSIGETWEVSKIRWFGKGINSNARERAVVIHGADYVFNFIQNNKD
jgi:hypothetical protein